LPNKTINSPATFGRAFLLVHNVKTQHLTATVKTSTYPDIYSLASRARECTGSGSNGHLPRSYKDPLKLAGACGRNWVKRTAGLPHAA